MLTVAIMLASLTAAAAKASSKSSTGKMTERNKSSDSSAPYHYDVSMA
jgi:hypothetical protein